MSEDQELLACSIVGEDLSAEDSVAVTDAAVAHSSAGGQVPIDRLVKIYVKIRDAKAAAAKVFKAEEDKFNEKLSMIATELKARAQAEGVEGFKTDEGTVYLTETMKTSCADWAAFGMFLKDHDPLEFLEKRISSTAIKQYLKDNEGQLPPGVSIFRETEAKVRRAGEK